MGVRWDRIGKLPVEHCLWFGSLARLNPWISLGVPDEADKGVILYCTGVMQCSPL